MTDKRENEVRKFFLGKNETLSIAESVTGGLLQLFFSGFTDAEKFFQGGITTYNIGQKCRHLGVEPIHANECNCVSPKVAQQMASNVCLLFSSDWGIGITGYATPVPESGGELFCYYAISYKGKIKAADRIDCKKMSSAKVQELYVRNVVDKFVEMIGNEV